MSWGQHLVLDLGKCINVQCEKTILAFSKELVQRIDMVPYGEPLLKKFGSGKCSGFTLVQLIETSNITGHFVDDTDDIYLDIFSCKKFSNIEVICVVQDYFRPQHIRSSVINRQAPDIMQ